MTRHSASMRWERLASEVRNLQASQKELFEHLSVLNRKVETIYDEQAEAHFLKEEERFESGTSEEVPPRAVT